MKRLLVCTCWFISLGGAGCSDDTGGGGDCAVGESELCVCADGTDSTRVCVAGGSFGACECAAGGACNDGTIDTASGEVCDGSNFNGETCTSQAGLAEGVLACSSDCLSSDTTGCHACGNGTVEGPEVCDTSDFLGSTCSSATGGTLTEGTLSCDQCNAIVTTGCSECGNTTLEGSEVCDTGAFAGATCSSETSGVLTEGTLSCDQCNAIVTTGCSECGNTTVEGSEVCDTTDFVGASCSSETGSTLPEGSLSCTGSCSTIDNGSCFSCGNGTIEGPEVCESGNTAGDSCTSQTTGTLPMGALACDTSASCQSFDTSNCFNCGNNTIEGPEECDGSSPGSGTCLTESFDGGSIACNNSTCAYDTSGCYTCGDALCEGSKGELPTNCDADCNPWTGIAAGYVHSCGIEVDGLVSCWGSNSSGQLGNGTTNPSSVPVKVNNITNADQVVAGFSHNCALAGSTLWCWGGNGDGQIGDGSNTQRTAPVSIAAPTGSWGAVAAGRDHTCGIVLTGAVYCWGDGSEGQVGHGGTGDRNAPSLVNSIGNVDSICGGERHTCAVDGSTNTA